MPLLPAAHADVLVRKVVDLYTRAEVELLIKMAAALGKGIDGEHWAEQQYLEVVRYRRQAEQVLAALAAEAKTATGDAIGRADARGQAMAMGDLAKALTPDIAAESSGTVRDTHAIVKLAQDLTSTVDRTGPQILRSVDDIYRRVIASSSGNVLLGAMTRREVAQQALNRFARAGITGYVDRKGRKWEMSSYVEMATRASTMNAAIEGHSARLQATGHDLIIVSDVPQECSLCRPWEGKVLSLTGDVAGAITEDGKKVVGTLAQARAAGLFHPGCVVGDTRVSPGGGVGVSDSRWYEGPIVVIKTALGDELSITPNHPVLTPEGWVAAGDLVVGAHVVRSRGKVEWMDAVSPDEQQVPPRIDEVHRAFVDASEVPPVRVPTAAHDFHGDGGDSEVDVVSADSLLQNRVQVDEQTGKAALIVGGVRLPLLFGGGAALDLDVREDAPGSSLVRVGSQRLALCATHAREAATHSFAASDGVVSVASQARTERGLGEPDGSGRFLLGQLAGKVALDGVVEIRRRDFAGHVYNLQCENGWYAANSIVVHNCRHSISVYLPGITKSFGETADPQGDKDRQRLRLLERQVRAAKREELAAMGPEAKKAAGKKVRAAQARIREHVAGTSAKRQPHREQINAEYKPIDGWPGHLKNYKHPLGKQPWTETERVNRQEALGIRLHDEQLYQHEIETAEHMKSLGEKFDWVPKDPYFRPSNDITWKSQGDIQADLKTVGTASYKGMSKPIRVAVKKANEAGVSKQNYIIDIGDKKLRDLVRDQLGRYNLQNPDNRIVGLWVMSRGELIKIKLATEP